MTKSKTQLAAIVVLSLLIAVQTFLISIPYRD